MKIKIYADGSNVDRMLSLYASKTVQGFTTNPSLMAKEGITDYKSFIKSITSRITDMPISFEVITDDVDEMYVQASKIASYADNIYVKIPITNTLRESTGRIVRALLQDGIKVNVTAVMTESQIDDIRADLVSDTPAIVSIFAGRIADTGIDPLPVVNEIRKMCGKNVQLLWASVREVYNVYQAEMAGCEIITLTPDYFSKLSLYHKNLLDYSCETVKGFYDDAVKSGIIL
jgi:transaldolase